MSANPSPTKPSDDTIKFLIACIKTSGSGRPDFGKVTAKLGLVSKGAAAKKYERLLKAHNEFGSSPEEGEVSEGSPTKSTAAASPKKRKANTDENGTADGKAKKKRQSQKAKAKEDGIEAGVVKPEPEPEE